MPGFDRKFWDGTFRCTQIGSGSLGGKANGLVFIKDLLAEQIAPASFRTLRSMSPPWQSSRRTALINSSLRISWLTCRFEEMPDDRIAHAFQKADLPVELLGDLRALIVQVKYSAGDPLLQLLEDALERPFAGCLRDQDDPQQPVRRRYTLSPTG